VSKKSAKNEANETKAEETKAEETVKETENETASEEINEKEALENEIAELKDKNLRLMAEFENYKRRTRQEKESTYEFAVCDAVKNIIPVLDTLELSVKSITDDASRQGIELIIKSFSDILSKMNVVPIEAVGQAFDPELHNAVMSVDEGDGESGTVIEEFQKGYKLKERVIRHSMVKVKN